MTTTTTPPPVLAPTLEAHARRYIAARTRSGDALLEAVAALSDARAAAAHGEWGIFLAAVGLDDSRARALIRLHDACLTDPALADRVRSGWLSEAAARELLPAPADVRAAVLDAAEPPTLQDVRAAKRAATPDLPPSRKICPTCAEPILNGIWGPREECGECWHNGQRQNAPKRAATPAFTPTPLDAPANLDELRYQLGLTTDAPAPAAVAATPHLPDGWADATARANRLGLYLGMNMAGVFRLSNLSNSVDHQIETWPAVLALLDRKEAAAAVGQVRAAPPANANWNAIAQASYKLSKTIDGWATDPQLFLAQYRAIGLLLAAGGVLPALPPRPRAPRSADVSDQLAYLGKLETYVEALEERAGVRE